MKKSLLSTLIVTVFAASLVAQPILQNTVFPEIGDVFTQFTADSNVISEGNAGANQNWDFSALAPVDTPVIITIVDDDATPQDLEMKFPDANLATKFTFDGQDYYSFYRSTTGQLALLGSGGAGIIPKEYPNPEVILNVPLAYEGNFADDFYSILPYPDNSIYTTGSKSVFYDAYGTVKMPGGTFENAMRLKTITEKLDTTYLFAGYSVTNTTETQYAWYVNSRPGPLVTITYLEGTATFYLPGQPPFDNDIPLSKSIGYTPSVSTGIIEPDRLENLEFALAGPNPVTTELTLSIRTEQAQKNIQLRLIDAQGKQLQARTLDLSAGENILQFEVGMLPAGHYFVQVSDGRSVRSLSWQK